MQEGRRAEVWTWRLVAELTKVLPVRAVLETHPGGGQYDTVELHCQGPGTVGSSAGFRVAVNRPGRVHVRQQDGRVVARDLLTDLDHGLPVRDAAGWVAEVAGDTAQADLVVQHSAGLMSGLLSAAAGTGTGRWEWRSGYLDSSGGEGGRREEFFRAVPLAGEACRAGPPDTSGIPEARFWFLADGGRVYLAVEPAAGRVFLRDASFAADSPGALARCLDAARLAIAGGADRQAFRLVALRLAGQVTDDLEDFAPGEALTELAVWYTAAAGSQLVVVTGDHEAAGSMDQVLAYALAWQGDRDLILICPEGRHQQMVRRLAWIDSVVRVFTYGPEMLPRPAVIPARAEVVDEASRGQAVREARGHALGNLAGLVEAVVRWADGHWALKPAHRPSYLAWHCEGRKVLSIVRVKGGVRITAGVDYSSPLPGQEKALRLVVSAGQPLKRAERSHVEARVSAAIWQRLAGADSGHAEHRMQGALHSGPLLDRLGLARVQREYPAWRGAGKQGFLDFLGIDWDNRLHIVETKANPDDVTVVMQTLDYAIWVMANGAAIRDERGWARAPAAERVVIDFICAPPARKHAGKAGPHGHAIGRYLAGQLEVLSPAIGWRIWLVPDPLADPPDLIGPASRAPADSPLVQEPVQRPRWPGRVQAGLRRGGSSAVHPTAESALLPAARPVLADLTERGLDHRWVLSARSSQAFALNLFAPLSPAGVKAVFRELDADVQAAAPVEFEYRDPADRLQEARPHSPHQTQVDVVLRGSRADGARLIALVEVKFTEEFGTCSAYENPANPARDACRSAGLFGGQPGRCFQLSNHGAGHRLYTTYLDGVPVQLPARAADPGGCLVRQVLSQPMRNLALAHLLLAEGEADHVIFAVCAPMQHASSWRRYAELRMAFPDTGQRTIRALTAETVASHHPDAGAAITNLYPAQELLWPTAH